LLAVSITVTISSLPLLPLVLLLLLINDLMLTWCYVLGHTNRSQSEDGAEGDDEGAGEVEADLDDKHDDDDELEEMVEHDLVEQLQRAVARAREVGRQTASNHDHWS